MIKSFNSWDDIGDPINEAKIRGKQVLRSPSGKRQKIAYKVQGDNKFLIKMVRMTDIVANGKITLPGAKAINNFINSQLALVNTFGKIDFTFFKTKFIIYTVKRDTTKTEKIQFTIVTFAQHPEIKVGTQYISTAEVTAALLTYNTANQDATNSGLDDVVTDNTNTVNTDDTEGDPVVIIDDEHSPDEAEGTKETEDLVGNKFKYTMRTNMKTYLMEFDDQGAIEANVIGEDSPNGSVSWEETDKKVQWYTDADSVEQADKYAKWVDEGIPLYTDQEITNKVDKDFFTKMFTDEEYRNSILKEYNDEYGDSEINEENIKKMLFYKNEDPIFPELLPADSVKPDTDTTDTVIDTTGAGVGGEKEELKHF